VYNALRVSLSRALLALGGLVLCAVPATATMPPRFGPVPPALDQAFEAGLFRVQGSRDGLRTSSVMPVWNVPVILVSFADQPLGHADYAGRTPEQYFQTTLFDTSGNVPTGSVFDYYRWVSGQRIRVVGRVVATVQLPQPKAYYARQNWGLPSGSTDQSIYGFVVGALSLADPQVDWTQFDMNHDGYVDMVWVVHSGLPGENTVNTDNNLWSLTSRLNDWSGGEVFDTHSTVPGAPTIKIKVDRFSVMPELSGIHTNPQMPCEIGVYCHEFGHALGLPDLYDTSVFGGARNVGTGDWDLMAYGGYGANDMTPESPAHMGAWCSLYLGWAQSFRPSEDTLMVQGPIENGAPIVDFWFQGEQNPEHFLIENRQRLGFDRYLPKEGLIVYHLDDNVIALGMAGNRINAGVNPGLRVVEADGQYDMVAGRNRGDVHDPFPGSYGRTQLDDDTEPSTRSFGGAVTQIALRQIEMIGTDARYQMRVRAPGWQSARPVTASGFDGPLPSGPGNRALDLADGSVAIATSEPIGGRNQIVLRTRTKTGAWAAPLTVTASPGTASDPTLAALPNGRDLVLVWTDSRFGPTELYYRARIGGTWMDEHRLTDLEGDSRSPSVGVDRFGRVHLAWLYTVGITPGVRFMSFGYFSPFGTPITVTDPTAYPDAPVVAVGPDGGSYVLWPDRAGSEVRVAFARYNPDSGMSKRNYIARNDDSEPAVDALVDGDGNLHVVFQVNGQGVNQFHYQKRTPDGRLPAPFDTVIVSRGESVQTPVLRTDASGDLHLAFTTNHGGVQQVRYKRYVPGRGWDYSSTEVTRVEDGPAIRPTLVGRGPEEVSVFAIGFPAGRTSLLEYQRTLPAIAVSVPDVPRIGPTTLRLGPNPLRAGSALSLRWPLETTGDHVDFYDLSGRRIASAALIGDEHGASAELPGSFTSGWTSGVYFARLRGRSEPAARLVVLR
jgi:immune inhibitor A